MDYEFEKALNILKKEEKNAQENRPNDLPEIYTAYLRYYISKEDFKTAKKYAYRTLEISQKSNNKTIQGYGFFAQAYYLKQLENYEEALDYAKKVQNIIEKTPNINPDLASRTYYLLYSIHSHWEDSEIINKFADLTILWAKKAKNYSALMSALSGKSTAMRIHYQKTKNKAYQDSIKYYLKQANTIYEKHPDIISEYTYAMTNVNIADAFYQDLDKNPNVKDSINFYLDKTNHLKLISDFNYEVRANILGIRSMIAMKNGEINTAEQYLLTALTELKKEEKRPAYYTIMNVLTALIEIYKQKKDFPKALELSEQKLIYNQKEYDATTAQKAKNLEAKYENEKLKSNLEHALQKEKWRNGFITALVAILGLIFCTLYFTIENHKKKILLEKQTQEKLIAEQKILILEKDKIQKEALISALQIEQKNKTLEEIKLQVKNEPEHYFIKKALNKEARIDKSLNQNETDMSQLHPQFFEKLKEIGCLSKLTKREEKICAYIYLGLDNKELAALYNVEPKTIRMYKYRIKQKLELNKDIDLEEFLKNLM